MGIFEMKKELWKLIGYIPDEVSKKYSDINIQEYWTKNNSFINGYDDKYGNIVLTYRCYYLKRKLKVYIKNFKWYGFIDHLDFCKIPKGEWKKIKLSLNLKVQMAKRYYKIYVKNESINPMYTDEKDNRLELIDFLNRYEIDFLESDLNNTKRFCIDNEIEIADNFKWICCDIETDDRLGGIVIGRDRILSFAAVDQDNKKYFFILEDDDDGSEVRLLEKIMKFIGKYDVMITWNGKMFDVPYIKERYKKYFGFIPSFRDIAHVDFMERFRKLFYSDTNIKSWSLEFCSQYFLQEGKVEHDERSYEMWECNKPLLKKYNIQDCQLIYNLEKKLKVLSFIIKECRWCGTFPTRFYISEVLDNYILRYSNKQGIHFKSSSFGRVTNAEKKEDVIGGYLIEPIAGLYENVYCLDFKSLYPSIIMSWNLGLDVFIKNKNKGDYIKTVNGFYTVKNKKGILPSIIIKLLKERRKYKAVEMKSKYGSVEYDVAHATQMVIKEMANSMYGIMAQKGNRYYNKDVAESITLGGHFFIKRTKKILEDNFNYNVFYGDSVPYDTYIPFFINGKFNIYTIGELFNKYKNKIKYERNKEIIYFDDTYDILTLSGKGIWKKINRLIRHKTNKKIYDITYPYGQICVTSDHSFFSNGNKKSSNDYNNKDFYNDDNKIDTVVIKNKLSFTNIIKYIDLYKYFSIYANYKCQRKYICEKVDDNKIKIGYITKGYGQSRTYIVNRYIKINNDFGRILGGYIAEGSVAKSKIHNFSNCFLYASTNKKDCEEIRDIAMRIFGSEAVIWEEHINNINDDKDSYRIKLKMYYYACLFEELCGYSCINKKMPDFVFETNEDFVKNIIDMYQFGDGTREIYRKDINRGNVGGKCRKFVCQSYIFLEFFMSKKYNYKFKQHHEKNCIGFEYRNINTYNKRGLACIKRQNKRKVYKHIHKRKIDGYVYDIEVQDDHTFIDCCGGTILHNTDSVFFSTNDNVNTGELLDFLNNKYKEILKNEFNIGESYVEIEYEKKYKKFIMIQKKNYVGRLIVKDGKDIDQISGVGLEYIKRDTNEYGRHLQEKIIYEILYDNMSLQDCIQFVKNEMNIFLNSDKVNPNDIIIKTRVSKPLSAYKTKSVHVRVAEKMIEDCKDFYVGMEVPYIVVGKGEHGLEAIHADDYKGQYDIKYYWDKRIYALVQRILMAIYPDYDWKQFLVTIIERRLKQYNVYKERLKKCKTDKQKNKIFEMIEKNKMITQKQKDVLLGRKKIFKIKRSDATKQIMKKLNV